MNHILKLCKLLGSYSIPTVNILLVLIVSQYFGSAKILSEQDKFNFLLSPLVRVQRSPQSGVGGAVEDEPPLSDYNYDDEELKQPVLPAPPPAPPAPPAPSASPAPPDGKDEEDAGLQKNKSRKPQEIKPNTGTGDEIPPFPGAATEAKLSPSDDYHNQEQGQGQIQESLDNMQVPTPPTNLEDESDGIVAKSKTEETTIPPDLSPKKGSDNNDEDDDSLSKNKAGNLHDKATTGNPDEIMKPMEKLKMKLEETETKLEETYMKLEETSMKLGETTTKLTETTTKLEETTTKLEETVKDLNGTKKKLTTTTTTLEETITTLEETTTKLKNTGKKLEKTVMELNETKEELKETKVKLNETMEKLEEITHESNTTYHRNEQQTEDTAKTTRMCAEMQQTTVDMSQTTPEVVQATPENSRDNSTESEQKIDAAGAEELKEEEEHMPGMPYKFKYEVSDEHGNDHGHKAKSNGEVVKGEYHVVLPDGTLQLVRYTADWKNGYVARVKYIRASPAHEDY